MQRESRIELIDIAYLEDTAKLKEIDHWLRVMNWENGWHYDLDIIWILQNIEKLKLPFGATIVDAGAGLGITQFILAARGYNIISIDFAPRDIPRLTKGIFDVSVIDKGLENYHHDYMDFINYRESDEISGFYRIKRGFDKLRVNPAIITYYFRKFVRKYFNVYCFLERFRDHKRFGKITFVRGTFNNLPIADCTADALISVSAYEHNTYEDMEGSVDEFARVLKPSRPMLVTTSAADEKDWFFEPAMGWNLTYSTLCKQFDIESTAPFDFGKGIDRLKMNTTLQARISQYYKFVSASGLPFGRLEDAKYIPVGIIKYK